MTAALCRQDKPDRILERLTKDWELGATLLLDETPRAWLFTVETADFGLCVLKILKTSGIASEGAQGALLQFWGGIGTVICHKRSGPHYLMELLNGPSLGDMSRNGQDEDAAHFLAEIALKIGRHERPGGVPDMATYTESLSRLDTKRVPALHRSYFERAQARLRQLIETSPLPQLLHGDLHHDNIRRSPRGWLALDPKGVWGDPHFEFANSFRNPEGMRNEIINPARAEMLADVYSQASGLDRQRLLDWAAVKSVLSMCWSSNDPANPSDEMQVVEALWSLCD